MRRPSAFGVGESGDSRHVGMERVDLAKMVFGSNHAAA